MSPTRCDYCGMVVRGPTGVGAHVGQLGAHYGSGQSVSTSSRVLMEGQATGAGAGAATAVSLHGGGFAKVVGSAELIAAAE